MRDGAKSHQVKTVQLHLNVSNEFDVSNLNIWFQGSHTLRSENSVC